MRPELLPILRNVENGRSPYDGFTDGLGVGATERFQQHKAYTHRTLQVAECRRLKLLDADNQLTADGRAELALANARAV